MFRKAFTTYLKATFFTISATILWAVGYILFSGFPEDIVTLLPAVNEHRVIIGLTLEALGFFLGGIAVLNYGVVIREQEENSWTVSSNRRR